MVDYECISFVRTKKKQNQVFIKYTLKRVIIDILGTPVCQGKIEDFSFM